MGTKLYSTRIYLLLEMISKSKDVKSHKLWLELVVSDPTGTISLSVRFVSAGICTDISIKVRQILIVASELAVALAMSACYFFKSRIVITSPTLSLIG